VRQTRTFATPLKAVAAKKTARNSRRPLRDVQHRSCFDDHRANRGISMKRLATALALCLAFTSMTAPAALAEQQAFRTVEARSFSTQELQQYGLSAADAAQVAAYQEQGYQVAVLTPEEAEQYQAGLTTSTWLIIGLVVIVVAVAVSSD
jgi:hypothetical protein